jgi:predicted secreted protein
MRRYEVVRGDHANVRRRVLDARHLACVVGVLIACGGEPASEPSAISNEGSATTNAPSGSTTASPTSAGSASASNGSPASATGGTDPSPTEQAVATPTTAPPDEADLDSLVDLLHSVRTELATSSAYQDRETQVRALFDGDLETAWNSRTGDLRGAWIAVRIPTDAQVFSIHMTVGFTKLQGTTDLFTGNHRVVKVKVSRDGTELGVATLDVESRELQLLDNPDAPPDFDGPGGVYRFELVELRPGSNPRWQEACISELRILGSSPRAVEDSFTPTIAIGALPPPYVAPPANRDEIARAHQQRVHAIDAGFADMLLALHSSASPNESDLEDLRSMRRTTLNRAADFVEPVDADAAAGLRARLARSVAWTSRSEARTALTDDLDALARAMEAVATWLGDDAARCRWARAHAGLRLSHVEGVLLQDAEALDAELETSGEEPVYLDLSVELSEAAQRWKNDSAGTARRLERLTKPTLSEIQRDWDTMIAQIGVARTACGW